MKKHALFAEKLDLQYPILSDNEHKIIEKMGFWKMKKMYGKEYMGGSRSTVLIDPEGIVRKIWENVKVKGHVNAVLEEVKVILEI